MLSFILANTIPYDENFPIFFMTLLPATCLNHQLVSVFCTSTTFLLQLGRLTNVTNVHVTFVTTRLPTTMYIFGETPRNPVHGFHAIALC